MSPVLDVTTDLPPAHGLMVLRGVSMEEGASLAEELLAYHRHLAPLFYRREQREWADIYLRGLLTADVPRKNVEAMALRLLGAGPHAERQVRVLQSLQNGLIRLLCAAVPSIQRDLGESLFSFSSQLFTSFTGLTPFILLCYYLL